MTNPLDPHASWLVAVDIRIRDAASMLIDADLLQTPHELLDFFEKPQHWAGEISLWQECGRPTSSDPGWDLFAHRLQRSVDG